MGKNNNKKQTMQITVSFPDAGFPDFSFPATVNSVVEEVIEAAAKEWDVEPTSFELSFAGEVLSPTSTLASHGLEAGSQLTASKAYHGYCYSITTCNTYGGDEDTKSFDNLSLEDAKQYAVHLKVFADVADDYFDEEPLEREIPNYNEGILPEIVGTSPSGEKWRNIRRIHLTYVPEAAMPKEFSWTDFVVPVPALDDEPEHNVKRRKHDNTIENAPNDGYRLTIDSYECDMDYGDTKTLDDLSLETVRLYATALVYCNDFGNADCSPHLEEETEIIDKISDVLKVEYNAEDLMRTLFGLWIGVDENRWRVPHGVKLENIQNRDSIKKIKFKDFAKTAYELAMAEKKKQKAGEE
eukprot:TRINITY_DN6199_c0_g1_i1.p1 TRINITY_DN6199_c0_g1~~TRINITY_DN6199_c0_g1_i1.p1  ORF type:complete len:354 (+),score=75.28 TRINITY_DN6199_c0_g1_i1:56-1117(+)